MVNQPIFQLLWLWSRSLARCELGQGRARILDLSAIEVEFGVAHRGPAESPNSPNSHLSRIAPIEPGPFPFGPFGTEPSTGVLPEIAGSVHAVGSWLRLVFPFGTRHG